MRAQGRNLAPRASRPILLRNANWDRSSCKFSCSEGCYTDGSEARRIQDHPCPHCLRLAPRGSRTAPLTWPYNRPRPQIIMRKRHFDDMQNISSHRRRRDPIELVRQDASALAQVYPCIIAVSSRSDGSYATCNYSPRTGSRSAFLRRQPSRLHSKRHSSFRPQPVPVGPSGEERRSQSCRWPGAESPCCRQFVAGSINEPNRLASSLPAAPPHWDWGDL